jgi:hypothetical protein
MWDFSLARSLAVLAATGPYILLRMAVYFGVAVAYAFAAGTGGGFAYGLGLAFADAPLKMAVLGGIFGLAVVTVALYFLREYLLYLVKAGHIAVMVEILDGRSLPAGETQIGYGRQIVEREFAETGALFALDQMIKGVIAVIVRLVWTVTDVLSVPGFRGLAAIFNAVLRTSLTYADEIILAHNFRTRSADPWKTSQDALVLYAQNHRLLLKNAVWLALFMYGLTGMIFLLVLAPATAAAWLFPGGWTGFGIAVAILAAWTVKASILEPIAIASLMQVYFTATDGQIPDPDWRARLEEVSSKFRGMGDRGRPHNRPVAGTRSTP